jgi:hypothetical protein
MASTRASAVTASQPAGKEVDLLAQVDLARDVLAGHWNKTANGITSDATQCSRIKLPYKPPAEYDFIVEFTRIAGNEAVTQLLNVDGHPCQWFVGGFGNSVNGLQLIAGREGPQNETQAKCSLKNGQRVRSVVQVRKDSVTALLDGKQVSRYAGKASDLSLQSSWGVGAEALGVGCWNSRTVFHKIAVVEIAPPAPTSSPSSPSPSATPKEPGELIDQMTGDTSRKEDDAIVLREGERISSREKFSTPVSFKIVAMTDSDLRIGCAADQIIFNWKNRPTELRIDGGPANGRHRPGLGSIPVNEWVEIGVDVTRDRLRVHVNGKLITAWKANFSGMTFPVSVFQGDGSTIKVKSVRLVKDQPNAPTSAPE